MYNEYSLLAKQIQRLNLGNYLEFGCGNGGFLKYVLEMNDTFKSVTAVDINPITIEQAKEALIGQTISFIVQEALPLHLNDHQFDTITLSNTLHHLKDKPGVLAELKRLIKPGGKLVLTEMTSNDLDQAEQVYCRFHALRAKIDRLYGIYHETTLTASQIKELVIVNGLQVEKEQTILNDKIPRLSDSELSEVETTIDDLVLKELNRPEYPGLIEESAKIKALLRQVGIKRPRQLYMETTS